MCDYSLERYDSTLAQEGQNLVTHRFDSGSMGLINDPRDVQTPTKTGIAGRIMNLVTNTQSAPTQHCPVCVPPGAILQVTHQDGSVHTVKFDQITMEAFRYRDAFEYPDGRKVLIQKIPEGTRVTVLSLSKTDPEPTPNQANLEPVMVLANRA